MSRKLQGLGLAALLALTLNAGAAHAQASAADDDEVCCSAEIRHQQGSHTQRYG